MDSTNSSDPEGYNLNNEDIKTNDDEYAASIVPNDETFIQRLETLSKKLSRRSTKEHPLIVDPSDFDLVKILSTFVSHAEKQGIHLRQSGITFKDVCAYGVDESASFVPTVGDLLKGPVGIYQKIKASKNTPDRTIIKNITGMALPGEMVLVLGRPGAGCSTFLRNLSAETSEFTATSGDIFYDGLTQQEMVNNFKSDIIYNPELDVHFPHLTVDQTLRFAIGCKTPETRVDNLSREAYITGMRDILGTVFGLRHTYNTKVGNDFVRGVSGGERKRVSVAEALAARGSCYCWDNATRGLDASTALEYTQAIRAKTNLLKSVAFVTIYQAGENIYETFDRVTVLYSGRQIYFGPVERAKKYFIDMGFECPARQATAEYLTAVTDPMGRTVRAGYENKVPKNADEFEQYWLNSPEYKSLIQEIDAYNASVNKDATFQLFYNSIKQEKMKHQRMKSRYTVTFLEQLRLCTIRGFQRIYGDKAYTITQVFAATMQALVSGSMYWNTPNEVNGVFSRTGIVFFSVLYFSLMGIAEIAESFVNRPILKKHNGYSFYHPAAEALSATINDVPLKLIIVTVFSIILYFLSNLKREAGKFFLYYLFLFITAITMTVFFRGLAALNKSIAAANAVGGIMLLAILMYSSFMIQRPSMHPWFKWISYINPVAYSYEAMISSELHGREMECGNYLVPSGPGYENVSPSNQVCGFKGSKTGVTTILGDNYLHVAFRYRFDHVWRNFGIIIAFLCFFVSVHALATEFIKPMSGGGDKLMFKKGKLPDNIILPQDKPKADVETVAATTEAATEPLPSEKQPEIFAELATKDVFTWKNVKYVIPYDGAERTLLDDVSGYCKPGTLTALMGESGAGKTTLLNTLAQRINMGVVTGDMLVNGQPLDVSFSRRTGYVQQQDLHISELTVRESLIFAARMRRSKDVPDAEKLEYVEKIIDILGMNDYAEAVVGDPGFGLNVEQRKKLSIGVELVAKPTLLLFLDEPTSGLDSQSAWAIVQLLRALANAGQSILCTIHQPSATLFEEFDRLLLLKKGGQTVYFGDIGNHSDTLLSYFERNGARHCDEHENPAEYILEAIGAGATASVQDDWHQIWAKSPEHAKAEEEVDTLIAEYSAKVSGSTEDKELLSTYAAPYLTQLRYVLARTSTQFWRSPDYIGAKLGLSILPGLFIGFTFWDLKHTVIGSQNSMFTGFLSLVIAAPLINQIQGRAIASRELYEVRESLSNTFHWSALLISQWLVEVPYCIVSSTIFYCCLYFPTKANTSADHAGIYYLTYSVMFSLYYTSFGLFLIYVAPDLPSASVLVSLCFAFTISFCGVVQPLDLMPGFWTFMYKVSPYTYFVQNLVSSILSGVQIHCAQSELSYFDPPSGQTCYEYVEVFLETSDGHLTNPNSTSNCGYCSYTTANAYMETIGIKYSHVWRNFGFFWVYVIFNFSVMLFAYYIFRVKRINPVSSVLSLFKKK